MPPLRRLGLPVELTAARLASSADEVRVAFREAMANHCEGLMIKGLTQPYVPGDRKAWLKLPDEPAVGWRVVDVVAEDGAFVSIKDGAASTRVDRARLSDYDATYEDEALCSDVSRLASLHAAPLVSALARRFRARTTYTNVGDVLIAVNPWRDVPDAPGAPHVRDVATAALEGAVERRASQAIVISGESGAGKTVSATRIIESVSYTHLTLPTKA